MKKLLAVCLSVALLLGFPGCTAHEAPAGTTIETEPSTTFTIAPPETTEPVVTEAETSAPPPPPEGVLFLTVSSITFSLQGESEDIYVGSLPREAVTWTSQDESVATFENGILTATGVGSTTVSAQYGDQMIECSVSCLAKTKEELYALGEKVLRSPKRYPPELPTDPDPFFDDTAIVGDSISYIMFQYETKHNYLGNPVFLVRGGTGVYTLVERTMQVYYQGAPTNLEDAIAASGVKKVFIMLGQNDLGYLTVEQTMEVWDILLNRIVEKSPDIEIYLQSCIPEWFETYASNRKNEKIDQHNQALKAYAEEHGYHYVDIEQYVKDHTGRMASVYSMDQGMHMEERGCCMWMQALKAYVKMLEIKGECE